MSPLGPSSRRVVQSLRKAEAPMTIPASGQRRIRIRRIPKRSRFNSGGFALAVALFAAALVAVAAFAILFPNPRPLIPGSSGVDETQDQEIQESTDSAVSPAARPVYRHSVIPGGVFTPEELKDALVEDAVAAAHYKDVDAAAIKPAVVKEDRYAYVSYRKDDQIFWTRNKVRLAAGETILTDGTNEIRARCGNCISESPMLPVAEAEAEPDLAELDRLVDESDPGTEPLLAAAVRSVLESPGGALGPGGTGGSGGIGGPGGGPASGFGSGETPSEGGGPGGVGGVGPTGFGGSRRPPTGGPTFFAPGGSGPDGDGTSGSNPPGGDPPGGTPPGSLPPWSGGPGPGGPTDNPGNPFVPPGNPGGPWIPPGIDPPPGYTPPPGGGNPPGSELDPPGGPHDPPPGGPSDPPEGGPEDPTTREVPAEPAAVPEPGLLILMGSGAAAALARKLRRNSKPG